MTIIVTSREGYVNSIPTSSYSHISTTQILRDTPHYEKKRQCYTTQNMQRPNKKIVENVNIPPINLLINLLHTYCQVHTCAEQYSYLPSCSENRQKLALSYCIFEVRVVGTSAVT